MFIRAQCPWEKDVSPHEHSGNRKEYSLVGIQVQGVGRDRKGRLGPGGGVSNRYLIGSSFSACPGHIWVSPHVLPPNGNTMP